jgi:hypothetical protein
LIVSLIISDGTLLLVFTHSIDFSDLSEHVLFHPHHNLVFLKFVGFLSFASRTLIYPVLTTFGQLSLFLLALFLKVPTDAEIA